MSFVFSQGLSSYKNVESFFMFLDYMRVKPFRFFGEYIPFVCSLFIFLIFHLANPALVMAGNLLDNEALLEDFSKDTQSQSEFREVSPPIATQQIRSRLAKHHPKLTIESPSSGEILNKRPHESWDLVLTVNDWPLIDDPDLGLGPHLVVQVDNSDPIRITHSNQKKIVIPMKGLSPGTHRIGAYLAYPWGESLKDPNTFVQSRVHFFKEMKATQPDLMQPWITVVSPSNWNLKEPVLIDFLLWNAPLQGFKEGDNRWLVKISLDEESFLVDRLGAIWIAGIHPSSNLITFELIDNIGQPIYPVFNNQLGLLSLNLEKDAVWMHATLSESELKKLIGDDEVKELNAFPDEQVEVNKNEILSQVNDDPFIAEYDLIFPQKTN